VGYLGDLMALEEAVAWGGLGKDGEGYETVEPVPVRPTPRPLVPVAQPRPLPKPPVMPTPPSGTSGAGQQVAAMQAKARQLQEQARLLQERQKLEAAAQALAKAKPVIPQRQALEDLGAALVAHEQATEAQKRIQADLDSEAALENWAKATGKGVDLDAWMKYNDRRQAEQEMVRMKANAVVESRVADLRRAGEARNLDDLKAVAKQAVRERAATVGDAVAKVADLFSAR